MKPRHIRMNSTLMMGTFIHQQFFDYYIKHSFCITIPSKWRGPFARYKNVFTNTIAVILLHIWKSCNTCLKLHYTLFLLCALIIQLYNWCCIVYASSNIYATASWTVWPSLYDVRQCGHNNRTQSVNIFIIKSHQTISFTKSKPSHY